MAITRADVPEEDLTEEEKAAPVWCPDCVSYNDECFVDAEDFSKPCPYYKAMVGLTEEDR